MNSRLSLITVVEFLFMTDILPSDKTKSPKKLNIFGSKYIEGMAHAIKAIQKLTEKKGEINEKKRKR